MKRLAVFLLTRRSALGVALRRSSVNLLIFRIVQKALLVLLLVLLLLLLLLTEQVFEYECMSLTNSQARRLMRPLSGFATCVRTCASDRRLDIIVR